MLTRRSRRVPEVSDVRLRLDVGYDGSAFHGWAVQPGLRTVAGELSDGLARVLRLDHVDLVVAGRTDAGVHARGQVAHVDVPVAALAEAPGRSSIPPTEALVRRLAGVLEPDLVVRAVSLAPAGFDARFSATSRHYCYRLSDTPHRPDPLTRHQVLWVREPLDVPAMSRAAQPLTGEHDFIAFCRPRAGASTVRTLHRVSVARTAGGRVEVTLRADAFCHNQVRSLVGALLAVGTGRRDEAWPGQVLAAQQRDGSVHVAPAHGLTLEQVDYPCDDQLAAQAEQARTLRGQPR